MSNNKLPQLSDLTRDLDKAYKGDELNRFLNHPPKKEWIKTHPYIKGHRYIPIGIIEMLLKMIFREHQIEITGQGTSFNGVWVTVRVHYMNPVTGEWRYHDGIGAIQMQMRAKTDEEKQNNEQVPFVPENINNGALSMAFPHAETLAIKDACDKFGKLFGSDLNRRDTIPFQASKDLRDKVGERINKLVDQANTIDDLDRIMQSNTIPDEYLDLIEQKMEWIKNNEKTTD